MPLVAKTLEFLREIDVFSKLNSEQLQALADIGQVQSHKPGKVIIRQGERSDNFQVVLSGQFDCYLWDDLLKIERPLTVLKRGDIFGEVGLLTDDTRSAFVRAQEESETIAFEKAAFLNLLEKQPQVLVNFARILAQRLAAANKAAGIQFAQLATYKITPEVVELVPLQVILRYQLLPIARKEKDVTIALVDPTDQVARNTATQFLSKHKVSWVCISQVDFENFRDRKLFDLVQSKEVKGKLLDEELTYPSVHNASALEGSSTTSKLVDELISATINSGASDIHFEPGPQNVAVRARIDGRLVSLGKDLSYSAYKPVVSRLKVLADMDITETRLPQDSVLRVRYGQRNIDLRISTVPVPHGEAVACRLFDPVQRKLDFQNLVVADAVGSVMKKLFCLPNGLLLVTGPTGSGKTTTLYAGLQLRQAQSPTNKIVTAEDPIEYELAGTTQVQVNTSVGLDFERILRSLLRQDPDVILVGEMRDKASVEIALEAALTGHFVLSSLHTNSALETVARIRQRGIDPYVIASALRGIISQRLVPRLCSACAEPEKPNDESLKALLESGIIESLEKPTVWGAKGCAHCRMTGYKGRLALYEVLVLSESLKTAIEEGVALSELGQAITPGTFVPMQRYARFVLEKGLVGARDLLEVLPPAARVAGF